MRDVGFFPVLPSNLLIFFLSSSISNMVMFCPLTFCLMISIKVAVARPTIIFSHNNLQGRKTEETEPESSPQARDPFAERQILSQKPPSGILLTSHCPEHVVLDRGHLNSKAKCFSILKNFQGRRRND